MAIIQISQIQIRRGYLQDLGQLGSGEFGWAIDKLRLFIGNGTVGEGAPYEGNTELLTQHTDLFNFLKNYHYRGILGGYEVLTGESYIAPTTRTFQSKLDDIVNILDFGATGDGFSDNSVLIQRAINEIYGRRESYTAVNARRIIRFHPGIYRITEDLCIPPYCVFENTGKDSVIIEQIGLTSNCVFKTTTSDGLFSDVPNNNLNQNSQFGPIEMRGITFKTLVPNQPIGIIDSAKNISFHRCQFQGADTTTAMESNSCGIKITSLVSKSRSIFFNECDFSQLTSAAKINSDQGTSEIVFDRCTFYNLYQGIIVDSNSSQLVGIRVTNSAFDSITQQGLLTTSNVDGVVSSFNTYLNVGNSQTENQIPSASVIEFGGNVCYSIADIFTRSFDNDLLYPTVISSTGIMASMNIANQMQFGNTYQTIGRSVIVNNNSVNYIPISPKFKSGIIDYSIERDNTVRSGTLKFSLNKDITAFDYHDLYTETDPIGVDISVEYNPLPSANAKPYIICIADARGYPSAITYDIKSLF